MRRRRGELAATLLASPTTRERVQVILSVAEHHSNLVPWQLVAQRTGAVLRHVRLTPDQQLDMQVSRRAHGALPNPLGRQFASVTRAAVA